MRTKSSCLTKLLTYILFSSLAFTVPQYVDCEDLYPDDVLDLFGISQNSGGSLTILKYHPSVCCFSNLLPKTHSFQWYESGNHYLERFTSELVLSVTLRC